MQRFLVWTWFAVPATPCTWATARDSIDLAQLSLEELMNVEVSRGPGGTLWGANAVNGVINVATRSAQDTQGWLLQAGGGSQERAFSTLRYGGSLGETACALWPDSIFCHLRISNSRARSTSTFLVG